MACTEKQGHSHLAVSGTAWHQKRPNPSYGKQPISAPIKLPYPYISLHGKQFTTASLEPNRRFRLNTTTIMHVIYLCWVQVGVVQMHQYKKDDSFFKQKRAWILWLINHCLSFDVWPFCCSFPSSFHKW